MGKENEELKKYQLKECKKNKKEMKNNQQLW